MYITVQDIADYYSCSKHLVYEILTELPDEEVAKCRINLTPKSLRKNFRYKKEIILKLFEDYMRNEETRRKK